MAALGGLPHTGRNFFRAMTERVISTQSSQAKEGENLDIYIDTSGTQYSGNQVYYALSGAGITEADFTDSSLTGAATLGQDGKVRIEKNIIIMFSS